MFTNPYLQNKILGPSEVVDYAAIIQEAYPPQVIASEPFVGFKVLCRDTGQGPSPYQRFIQLERELPMIIRGKGIIIREADNTKLPDGLWIITLPVPRPQMAQQLTYLMDVIAFIEQKYGIVRIGGFEINVSGRCTYAGTEKLVGGIASVIPDAYKACLQLQSNASYRIGNVIHINDNFACVRTRWDLGAKQVPQHHDDLSILSCLMMSEFR